MFIHQLSRRSTAMTSVLAAASPLLFRVREEPSQPTAVPIAPRQKFEKTFAIDAAPHAKVAPAIERLVVATPGLTYVSFDVNAPPSVKVSSELRETVDVFEVVHADDAALEIRLQDATRLDQQYILTEVSLPSPSALKSLDVRGGGTIVLDDNVLAVADKHADIRIRLFGSGDVFATSHSNIDVKSLSVELSGSGDMQLVAPTITTSDAFSSTISSSGDIRLFTGSIRAPQINMKTAGSGDMKISSLSIDASSAFTTSVSGSGTIRLVGDDVNAASISASVAGSGDIKFIAKNTFATGKFDASVAGSGDVFVATNNGRCDVGSMSVSGSGKVDARDLVANYAQINVTGSGSTVVRAGEVCTASVVGSGSAKIVGPLPPKTSGRFKSVSVEEKPSLVEKLTAKCGKEWSVPSRADAFEQLTRFNGTLNVRSFSDFITAVKLIWNHRSNDKVVIKAGYHSDD